MQDAQAVMLGLLGLCAFGPAMAGEVLVPEATPASMGDFQYAYMLYSFVVSALEDRGFEVTDGDEIRAFAGADADACADSDECPANLWERSTAGMALVMVVGQADDELTVEVRLYGADQAEPIKVIRENVAFGEETTFASKVAKAAADLEPLLPERAGVGGIGSKPTDDTFEAEDHRSVSFDDDEDDRVSSRDDDDADRKAAAKKAEAARKAEEQAEEERKAEEEEAKAAAKAEAAKKAAAAAKKAEADKKAASDRKAESAKTTQTSSKKAEPARSSATTRESKPSASTAVTYADDPRAVEERRKMGIPWWDYAAYRKSGLDSSAWLRKAQVRAGKAFFEVAGGYTMGDVDRGYGVRVGLDENFASTGSSSWTGPGAGEGAFGRLSVGYAPAWFLDTSISVGLQGGKKYLDLGWECPACTEPTSETPYSAVDATMLVVEPRARIFGLASGYVKPYALAAFTFTVYDGFHIPDESGAVDYSDVDGGASFGPTFGVGALIDPVSPVSIVIEVPWTLVVSDGETASTDNALTLVPNTLEKNGWVLRFVAGVGVRL